MDTFSVKKLFRTVMFLYIGLRSVSEVGLDSSISFGTTVWLLTHSNVRLRNLSPMHQKNWFLLAIKNL